MNKIKIIYIGTDKWANCLKEICRQKNIQIKKCFIPKLGGELHELCQRFDIPYKVSKNINNNYEDIKNINFDLYVVIGHPFLLRENLLKLNSGLGFHPTKLPLRRGRAPINWLIIDGLKKTALTIFKLGLEADDGNLLFQEDILINKRETAITLIKKIDKTLKNNIISVINNYQEIKSIKQDHSKATYTIKRNPDDGEIKKNMSSEEVERLVRSLQGPYPSAFIRLDNGEKIYVHNVTLKDIYQKD